MADTPYKPRNNGKIGMPKIGPGQNKFPTPLDSTGGKGSDKDPGKRAQGPVTAKEAGSKGHTDKNPMIGRKEENDRAKILTRAVKRMDLCISGSSDNRKEALEDRRMMAGDQWPADVKLPASPINGLALTINKLPTFVRQVTNNQRENRPAIHASPIGDQGDPEAAKYYDGMIRAIDRDSHADIAYDTAFEDAATSGEGFWLLDTEFVSPDSMDQVIVIKRIKNPFTVYFDPAIQEPDAADARYAFISEMVPRSEFKEKYPNAQEVPWTLVGTGDTKYQNWVEQDQIRVASYYEIEFEEFDLIALSNGWIGDKEDISDEIWGQIDNDTIEIIRERKSAHRKVTIYKMTAVEIIEESPWLGNWIPIVRVIGHEIDIEGKTRLSGIIRDARDSQRMFNYWRTSSTELIALAPKAPWIMAEGQDEGWEDDFQNSNTKTIPVLHYKQTDIEGKPAPPPTRQNFPQVPAGIVNAAQEAAMDMQATTGIRLDGTNEQLPNDASGRAVREARRNGDIATYDLMDNFTRALRHSGRMEIDLIPKIYDTKRWMTIIREDGGEDKIQIDPFHAKAADEIKDPQSQKTRKIFNQRSDSNEVAVTIGPSFATKRIEAAESMLEFGRALGPEVLSKIADLIAKNQDWPGATEISQLAKMLPPQLLTPESKDVRPQAAALLQSLQQQLQTMAQQNQALVKALSDENADRQVQIQKNQQDFEAKVLNIMAGLEKANKTHGASQFKDMIEAVEKLMHMQGQHPAQTLDLMKLVSQHTLAESAQERADKNSGEPSA